MEIYKNVGPEDQKYLTIANSETIYEGAFTLDLGAGAGQGTVDAAADPVYGLAVGLRDANGIPLGSGSADFDGTFTQNPNGNTYVAAADNLTDKQIQVQVKPVRNGDVYTGLLNADAGTTTGSDVPGYYISVDAAVPTQIDEASASTSKQHFRLTDNGYGDNSALHPIRGGNWVLFQVVEVQDYNPQP